MLAPLTIADRIPWKLDHLGQPQWLTVVAVLGHGRYLIEYPDGHRETLTDSE